MSDLRNKLKEVCEEQGFPFPEVPVLMGVGGFFAGQSDYSSLELAETAFRMILEIEPKNSDAMHNLGVILMRQGRSSESIPILSGALEYTPNDPRTLVALGSALSDNGDYPEALEYLERAANISPGSFKVLMNLVTCQVRAGEFEAAEKTLKDLLEADPFNLKAIEAKEIVEKQKKSWNMVQKIRHRLDEGDNPSPEDLESAFLASLQQGRPDLSVYFLELLGGEIKIPETGSVYSIDGKGGMKIEAINYER